MSKKKKNKDLPQFIRNLRAKAAGGAAATAGRSRVFDNKKDIVAKDTGDSEIDEGLEEYDDDAAHRHCYYHDDKVCEGKVWECETCHEFFCNAHSHTTDKGNNVECVACERVRNEKND